MTKEKTTEKKTSLRLKHTFSDPERLDIAQKLADSHQALDEAKDELEAIKADYKGRIGAQESQIGSLSAKLRAGYEVRETECRTVLNYTRGTVMVTRMDLAEVVECRDMTEQERQMGLDLED